MPNRFAAPPVALVTYSTRPRGGVAHTLALGEAMHALGQDVLIVGLGDPTAGFFRLSINPPSLTFSEGIQHFFNLNGSAASTPFVFRSVSLQPRKETDP